jgi:hypothetical protein
VTLNLTNVTFDVVPVPEDAPVSGTNPFTAAVKDLAANRDKALTFILPADPKNPATALINTKENPNLKEIYDLLRRAGDAAGVRVIKRADLRKVGGGKTEKVTGIIITFWATDKRPYKPRVTATVAAPAETAGTAGE